MKYPYLKPVLPRPESWAPLLETSYEQRYFSNFGPLTTRLETTLKKHYLADDYRATLVTSNTLGLQAVLNALEVKGKSVILPDFTFSGTLQAVIAAGGKPVLCDVLASTSELDPESVKAALEKFDDVAVIIHVRCYGFVNDITPIKKICKEHNIQLLVDAAAALARPSEQQFGSSYGEIEVFSLHATKVFAIGEGGMIAAPQHLNNKIRKSVNFGFNADRTFKDGTNAKMDEFRAAIGFGTLDLIDDIVVNRQAHAQAYIDMFKDNPDVSMLDMPDGASWSCFPILLKNMSREQCLTAFADAGIEVKKYYWPSLSKGYQGETELRSMPTPVSDELQDNIMCLPIYSEPPAEYWTDMKDAVASALRRLTRNG